MENAIVPTNLDSTIFYSLSGSDCCKGNWAAIGIYEEGTTYSVICRMSTNDIPFQAGNPSGSCSHSDRMKCMTKDCITVIPLNLKVMLGFQNGFGPCSSASLTGGVLNLLDCHTVSGIMQIRPPGKTSWTEWRVCGGNDTNLYLMTKVVVTEVSTGVWDLTSIKCCRVLKVP
ncbi:hypothetical protein SK128_013699 [Halocaridina rubra]|uniref:Uncharacterized protein n=1 Tax=Halocaridina rubra TaxID=373956 RepID=A0AAN8XEJ8_HALRR